VTARLPLVLLLVLAALAVGCGGSDDASATGSDPAAEAVPAGALAYVSVNADLESAQWDQLKEHVRRFPDSGRLVDSLLSELADEGVDWERDVEPAIGPEVAIVAVELDDDPEPEPVLLTKPDDEAKLDALLDRARDETAVRKQIDGWQVVGETAAQLEAFERALGEGRLADDEEFTSAVAELPEEALLKLYVDGDAFADAARRAGRPAEVPGFGRLRSIVGSAEAVDAGLKFAGTYEATGGDAIRSYRPTLLDRVPSGVLAVASFNGASEQLGQLGELGALGDLEGLGMFLPAIEEALGVSFEDLGRLFAGEGVVYVRQAAPIPEVTLLVRVSDADDARRTLDRLATRLAEAADGQTGETTLEDSPAAFVEVNGFRVTYGVASGTATITTSRVLEAPAEGERLADDAEFNEAKEASGLGDETAGFLYVNLQETIALIAGFAGLSGEEVPPELTRNLEALGTLLTHVSRDGDRVDFAALLTVE
jgi:hypothetical protein